MSSVEEKRGFSKTPTGYIAMLYFGTRSLVMIGETSSIPESAQDIVWSGFFKDYPEYESRVNQLRSSMKRVDEVLLKYPEETRTITPKMIFTNVNNSANILLTDIYLHRTIGNPAYDEYHRSQSSAMNNFFNNYYGENNPYPQIDKNYLTFIMDDNEANAIAKELGCERVWDLKMSNLTLEDAMGAYLDGKLKLDRQTPVPKVV